MRFDELNPTAQFFLIKYLKVNRSGKVKDTTKNQEIIDDYVELERLENEFKALMKELKDHRGKDALAKKVSGYSDFKRDGQFGKAAEVLRDAILLGEKVRNVIALEQARQDIIGAADALTLPPGGLPADKTGLDTLRQTVRDSFSEPYPSPKDFGPANRMLETLRTQHAALGRVAVLTGSITAVLAKIPGDDPQRGPAELALGTTTGNRQAGQFQDVVRALEPAWLPLRDALMATDLTIPASTDLITLQAERLRGELQDRIATGSEAAKKAARASLKVLDRAVTSGPLSRVSGGCPTGPDGAPVSTRAVAAYLEAIRLDAVIGDKALDMACRVPDGEVFAEEARLLCEQVSKGFSFTPEGRDGAMKLSPVGAREYGTQLLDGAMLHGPEFLPDFRAYARKGGFIAPMPFGEPVRDESPGHKRSRAMGRALLDETGDFAFRPEAVADLRDHMRFHFNEIANGPAPETALHMEKTLDWMENGGAEAVTETLREIAPPKAGTQGDLLMRQSLGLPPGDEPLSAAQMREALLTALLSPVYQGLVGSCFATAPVMDYRERDPAGFLAKLKSLAEDGGLTVSVEDTPLLVPAVTTRPPRDTGDPLVRSLEYTVATAGTVKQDSNERSMMMSQTRGALAMIGRGKAGVFPRYEPEGGGNGAKLASLLNDSIQFRYEPDVKGSLSLDGNSSHGRFVMMAGETRIDSEAAYDQFVLDTARKMFAEQCKDETFARNLESDLKGLSDKVSPHWSLPWATDSGGVADGPLEVLWGKEAEQVSFTDTIPKDASRSERTAGMLAGMLGVMSGPKQDQHTLRVTGVHALNAVPDHPSQAPLKGLAGKDLAEAIDSSFVTPGQDIANTPMPLALTQRIFDDEIESAKLRANDPGYDGEIAAAREKRPRAGLTAAALTALIEEALKAFTGKRVKARETHDIARMKHNVTRATLTALAPPEVVVADTNWGDEKTHRFIVMTTNPVTGAFDMFLRTEPSGDLAPLPEHWKSAEWRHCGLKEG